LEKLVQGLTWNSFVQLECLVISACVTPTDPVLANVSEKTSLKWCPWSQVLDGRLSPNTSLSAKVVTLRSTSTACTVMSLHPND
jgi:hypothetical protein